LFILTALCVFTSITFLGSSFEKFLKQSKSITKNINKIAALVYFSLAINLFFV